MKKIYLSQARTHRPTQYYPDINKRIVLNYVRSRSPISRADIARETSLQRSTVSAIIDDLLTEELIEELGMGDSTGGRKPTLAAYYWRSSRDGVDVTPRETTVPLRSERPVLKRRLSDFSRHRLYERPDPGKVKRFADLYKGRDLQVGISIPGIADRIATPLSIFRIFNGTTGNR